MTNKLPDHCVRISDQVAYSWFRCEDHFLGGKTHDADCAHDINHLLIWHLCDGHIEVEKRGPVEEGWFPCWRAAGVSLHTLIQEHPLTITASVYWPECCGLHGFITNGEWVPA